MSIVARGLRAIRRDGPLRAMRRALELADARTAALYRQHVWGRLPVTGYPRWNDVLIARPRRPLDPFLPASWRPEDTSDLPTYENALVAGLTRHVRPGDRVVIIGGGYGVTVVKAALLTGHSGSIICYEAATERVQDTRKALTLNGVSASVEVVHSVVGREISLFGNRGAAGSVAPIDLPQCDVLEMDCEGAEADILALMTIRPRVILVETHGLFGAPTAEIHQLLNSIGYESEDLGVAEEALDAFCLENDVRVLAGVLRQTA